MKKSFFRVSVFAIGIVVISFSISCEDDLEDTKNCNHCNDDAPYGTVGGGCYTTLSACESGESGNCVICQ